MGTRNGRFSAFGAYSAAMRAWWLLLAVLAGCSPEVPPRRIESAAAAEVRTRTFHVGPREITILEIPVQSGRRVEFMRCILVTSDRGESMHCPGETEAVDVPPDVDVPGPADRF